MKNLEHLDLSNNDLGDNIKYECSFLELLKNTKIKYLDLSDNCFSNEYLLKIIDIYKENKFLEKINLKNNISIEVYAEKYNKLIDEIKTATETINLINLL